MRRRKLKNNEQCMQNICNSVGPYKILILRNKKLGITNKFLICILKRMKVRNLPEWQAVDGNKYLILQKCIQKADSVFFT